MMTMKLFAAVAVVLFGTFALALDPSGWIEAKNGLSQVDACIAAGGTTWNFFGVLMMTEGGPLDVMNHLGFNSCRQSKILNHLEENTPESFSEVFHKPTVPNALICCSLICDNPFINLAEYYPSPTPPDAWQITMVSGAEFAPASIFLTAIVPHYDECQITDFGVTSSCSDDNSAVAYFTTPMFVINQALYIQDSGISGNVYHIVALLAIDVVFAEVDALVTITDLDGDNTYIKLSEVLKDATQLALAQAEPANPVWHIGDITVGADNVQTFTAVNQILCASVGESCSPA
eukprot:m.47726 g.47726  ORF g.47726 m.47726 type:complete len:290 (-) comp47616_c0_seq5:115-984(-)